MQVADDVLGVGQRLAVLVLGDGLGDLLRVGVDKVHADIGKDDKLATRNAGKLLVAWRVQAVEHSS